MRKINQSLQHSLSYMFFFPTKTDILTFWTNFNLNCNRAVVIFYSLNFFMVLFIIYNIKVAFLQSTYDILIIINYKDKYTNDMI
jgi:hypothetical protein